jgi:hypothetical protein
MLTLRLNPHHLLPSILQRLLAGSYRPLGVVQLIFMLLQIMFTDNPQTEKFLVGTEPLQRALPHASVTGHFLCKLQDSLFLRTDLLLEMEVLASGHFGKPLGSRLQRLISLQQCTLELG